MVDNKNESNENKSDVDKALEHVLRILREQNDQGLITFNFIEESSAAAKMFGFYKDLEKRSELLNKILLSPEDIEFKIRLEKNTPKQVPSPTTIETPKPKLPPLKNELPKFAPPNQQDIIEAREAERERIQEEERLAREKKLHDDKNNEKGV